MSRVKKTLGRPKKPEGRKKSNCVMVRFTDTEYERVKEGAKLSGLSMANYVKLYGDTDYQMILNLKEFSKKK